MATFELLNGEPGINGCLTTCATGWQGNVLICFFFDSRITQKLN